MICITLFSGRIQDNEYKFSQHNTEINFFDMERLLLVLIQARILLSYV